MLSRGAVCVVRGEEGGCREDRGILRLVYVHRTAATGLAQGDTHTHAGPAPMPVICSYMPPDAGRAVGTAAPCLPLGGARFAKSGMGGN